jgi:hypothetical protein
VITLLADVALTNNDIIELYASKHIALVVPAGDTRTIKPAASFPPYAALFTVASDSASLTLGQPSGGGNLIIDGGNKEGVTKDAALISLNNGPVVMYAGVTLQNNTNSSVGGAVVIGNAPGCIFTMHGGTIQGCQAEKGGGVFNVNSSASGPSFIMHGGTIRGNTATVSGGGVYIEDTAFVKDGGLITGNPTATGTGDTGDHTTESATRDDCNVAPAGMGSSVYASGTYAKLGTWTANNVGYDTDIDAGKVTGAANPLW